MGLPELLIPEVSARRISRHPVKVTALLYLKEALLLERYEECSGIILVAVEFGATASEIRNRLEVPSRAS